MASSLLRLMSKSTVNASKILARPSILQSVAGISTSEKNKDVATVSEPTTGLTKEPWQKEVEEEVAKTTKNWVSYGYSITDRDEDQWWHMANMFWAITMSMVGGAFILAYMPDYKMRDWIQREAYMELARREAEGLPLIDPDYYPRDKLILPSDEELGNFEIIL